VYAGASEATPRFRLSSAATDPGYGTGVTTPYVEIDPEAILIRMRVDASLWHIVDPERDLTWCGLFLSQGSERRPLSETPEDRRCETCIGRFGHDVVQVKPDL
jgi:hypothetical protein